METLEFTKFKALKTSKLGKAIGMTFALAYANLLMSSLEERMLESG